MQQISFKPRSLRSNFRLEVRDLDRVIKVRENHHRLLLQNYATFIKGRMDWSTVSLRDILGNWDSIAAGTALNICKVSLGTGAAAESPTDYTLTTRTEITTGIIGTVSIAGNQISFPVTGSIVPAVNRTYTEAAWSIGSGADDGSQYLCQREVFAGVAVNAGQTATATFTVTFN